MLRRILLTSAGAAALTTAAAAADLGAKAPPPPYVPPPPVLTWTGFYAGLNVGGTWFASNNIQTTTANLFDNTAVFTDFDGLGAAGSTTGFANVTNGGGVIGGGQIGYNFQFANNFVVGVEADIQGTRIHSRGGFVGFGADTALDDQVSSFVRSEKEIPWLGTVRGRLGWLVTPTLLLYGDGGLAYGGVRGETDVWSVWTAGTEAVGFGEQWLPGIGVLSKTRVGWTAGGGLEWMFMPNWSLKVEYLYFDLGRDTWFTPIQSAGIVTGTVDIANLATSSTRFNANIVRAGLNYHFNWGAPPVVAKY